VSSGSALLRLYGPEEVGPKGYPVPWERGDPRIPDLVRELAGHRCVRCQHPFVCGKTPGEWSPCDEHCTHDGPLRIFYSEEAGSVAIDQLSAGFVARDIIPTYEPEGRVEARWRVLTVHHLTGAKLDCRWWNLPALCQRCHLEIQGRVRMERVYILPHSEWFRPYVAGYYAWTYLREDLSREEVTARLDELLALEASPA
jgi:hypothetical protein